MKNFLLVPFLLLASAAFAQSEPWLNPEVTGINKQPPRTQLISFPSADLALMGVPAETTSMQLLDDGQWNETATPQGKTFSTQYKMPFAWSDREIFVRIPQADASFSVTVNGKEAGYSQSSRGGIEFDITKLSKEGNNDLQITIYSQPASRVIENYTVPATPGRPRGVCVFSQPRIRIRDIVADAVYENEGGSLTFGAVIATHLLNQKEVRIHYELRDPRGRVISNGYRDERFGMKTEDSTRFFVRVDSVALWSHATPQLYTLLMKMQQEGRYTEYVAVKVGFRTIKYDGTKLNVNGKDTEVRISEFTPAADLAADRARIEKLKTQGINTLRLLPYPQPEAFYQICDEVGIYLIDQTDIDTHNAGNSRKIGGNPSNDPAWGQAYIERALHMYHTSKLHPSIIAFSLANSSSANGINLQESYMALKAIEKTRPIVYLDPEAEWNTDATQTPTGLNFLTR